MCTMSSLRYVAWIVMPATTLRSPGTADFFTFAAQEPTTAIRQSAVKKIFLYVIFLLFV